MDGDSLPYQLRRVCKKRCLKIGNGKKRVMEIDFVLHFQHKVGHTSCVICLGNTVGVFAFDRCVHGDWNLI